jgi:hypothetical protein
VLDGVGEIASGGPSDPSEDEDRGDDMSSELQWRAWYVVGATAEGCVCVSWRGPALAGAPELHPPGS